MKTWPALLAAPSLALLCQSLLFSQVTPACASQQTATLQATAAGCLLLALAFTAMARSAWRTHQGASPGVLDSDVGTAATRARFLAAAATAVGALSSLVILMMWSAAWVLSPCAQ